MTLLLPYTIHSFTLAIWRVLSATTKIYYIQGSLSMALFVLKKKKTPGDNLNDHYVVFQSLSHVGLSVTPRTASTPGFRVLQLLPELAQTQVQ